MQAALRRSAGGGVKGGGGGGRYNDGVVFGRKFTNVGFDLLPGSSGNLSGVSQLKVVSTEKKWGM